MTSKRKIEEKIAETKDPVIRKQLQELLDKRERRWKQKKQGASNVVGGALGIVGDVFKSLNEPPTPKEKQWIKIGGTLFIVFASIGTIAISVSADEPIFLLFLFIPLYVLILVIAACCENKE